VPPGDVSPVLRMREILDACSVRGGGADFDPLMILDGHILSVEGIVTYVLCSFIT
jgi:hypothetical protein